jgi:hypothetical protein
MTRLAARTLISLTLLAAATSALAEASAPAASIAFADHGGIYDWKADGTKGLWVQDRSRNWYYAVMMGPCSGLNFAETLGFATEPDGSLNQHSAVTFKDGSKILQRCQFKSFQRSAPPPTKAKHPQPVQKAPAASK